MFKTKRIVRDNFAGYEVQVRCWYWPFWEMKVCNTHSSVEKAEEYAETIYNKPRYKPRRNKVVKYLD